MEGRLTLQKETEELYRRHPEAHAVSGRKTALALKHSTATYHGEPIKAGYLPKVFTEEGFEYLKENIEFCWKILVKIIRHYLEDAEYRKLFGFPEELEKLILARPRYRTLLPVCRLDLFLNEETGAFKFCEFNADGSSAMNENREMEKVFRDSLIVRELSEKYELRTQELFDAWAAAFLKICAETGELTERPNVAIVDFPDKMSSPAEFEEFRKAFERAGCETQICSILDLTFDGERLYTKDGMRVDAVYRRAVTSDIMEHKEQVRPFLEAALQGKVCLVGDFCTQIVHDKILFRILFERQTEQFLTEEENAFIRAHIPYTLPLTKERARDPGFRASKDHWIIKPENSYGADGVFTGLQHGEFEWEDLLLEYSTQNYIIQEYVPPYRTMNIDFGEAQPKEEGYCNMSGLYLYGGKLAGIYTRSSVTPVISVEGDEHEMMTYIAREKQEPAK